MASDEKEFLTLAKDFERVSPDKAEDILAQNDDVVVFVARETCPTAVNSCRNCTML